MVVEIVINGPDDLEALRGRLSDFTPIFEGIAKQLISTAQRSFEDQQFGGVKWPKRYPSQDSPSLNIAGLISDFNAGKEPPQRRFEDRPVGIDRGDLASNYQWKTDGPFAFDVGAYQSYAQAFHEGGEFSMPVLPETVDRLRDFVRKHPQYDAALARFTGEEPDEEYASRFARRPLMGVTEVDIPRIIAIVEEHLGGASSG